MGFRAQTKQAFAYHVDFGGAVLLLAFDIVAENMLLELAGQVFFEFAR
jgi:hypothetical protein